MQAGVGNNPIFHQMLFTLINESLLSPTTSQGKPTLLLRLKEQEDLIGGHLQTRWDNDRVMLKDYLDRYLIEAFGIQDSPLEKHCPQTGEIQYQGIRVSSRVRYSDSSTGDNNLGVWCDSLDSYLNGTQTE